ncbi:MAG: hypothetical protein NC395_11465 [Prevotella sp.]|nr:hypothetical protein [Prevotella sp.]
MKYQNDPTNPDYNPSPQERFKAGYIRRSGSAVIISIFFSRGVGTLLKSSTGKFGAVFNICLAVVLMTYAIVNLVQYILLTKNPEKLEELYRQHTDERNTMIREKTAGGSFTATAFIICAAILVSSYISVITTLFLTGILLAMLIIRLLLKIYYERKY